MNHYKKSALLERIEIQKEELRVIEEKNTKSREEAKSQLKIRLDEFMAKLTPKILRDFNEGYIKDLIKVKQKENKPVISIAYLMSRKDRLKVKNQTLRDIEAIQKLTPVTIVDGELFYCYNSCDYTDYSKHAHLRMSFDIYLQSMKIEYVDRTTSWMGIPQDNIDGRKRWFNTLIEELNCIDEDLIELETMSDHKNIFKETHMKDTACTIKE